MTVSEYIEALKSSPLVPMSPNQPSFMEVSLETTDIWSNEACQGYVIKASQSIGLSREEVKELLQAITWAFDEITVSEAEVIYQEF